MTENSEKLIFQEICREIKKTKKLMDNHKSKLTKAFGVRFENAYRAVEEEKVRKYIFNPSKRTVWVVIGKESMYQILPVANFCSCNDFYFRVIGHEIFLCYHLIAQKLAEALDQNEIIEKNDAEYELLMSKLREIPIRRRVRSKEEVENIRNIVSGILYEESHLSISQLLEELKKVGFNTLTTRHLTIILITDKKKRFQCVKGAWSLTEEVNSKFFY